MNPRDKNPVFPSSNSPPYSPPHENQLSDMLPSSSAQFTEGRSSAMSPNTWPFSLPSELFLPPMMSSPNFVELESLQDMEETVTAPTVATGTADERLSVVPQPLECLQGSPVPPFLSKTYDLADDPELDSIISWGAKGQSFVVWDHVEFARSILPRNFKHNNFSSFVRQLNTYGFRKIDADRWEFACEGFLRGNKHMLKNIQRRKTAQSQHVGSPSGSSSEVGKICLGGEVENLRKDRSLLMQELAELQQQQRGTIQHLEAVNEKLQSAEHIQKKMVTFMAKLLQNPAFMARLQQTKQQKAITSPRTMRKFLKHQQQEPLKAESSMAGQIVKYYKPDLLDLDPEINPVAVEQFPEFPLQDVGIDINLESVSIPLPFDVGEIAADKKVLASELAGGRDSRQGAEDPFRKKKNVVPQEVFPEYFPSSPDYLAKEKNYPKYSLPGIEGMVKEQESWSMDIEAVAGMTSSCNELWDNVANYDKTEIGDGSGLSDFWDLDSLHAGGSSGVEKWPADEYPF